MKRNQRYSARCERYARFIRRNKRRGKGRLRFLEARRAAREVRGLPPLDLSAEPRFELAPQFRVEDLWPQIRVLLKAFGHPEALITDESKVADMLRDGRKLVRLRRKLKISIPTNEYIVAVAERLRVRNRARASRP